MNHVLNYVYTLYVVFVVSLRSRSIRINAHIGSNKFPAWVSCFLWMEQMTKDVILVLCCCATLSKQKYNFTLDTNVCLINHWCIVYSLFVASQNSWVQTQLRSSVCEGSPHLLSPLAFHQLLMISPAPEDVHVWLTHGMKISLSEVF